MDPDQPTVFLRVCSQLEIEIVHERFAEGVQRANALLGPRQPNDVPRPFSQGAVDRFWTEYNRILLTACARDACDAAKAERVYRTFAAAISWRVYDDVRGTLKTLRAQGIRLGIISNWTGDLEDVLERVGLRSSFDFALDSARLGYEKPHGEIFDEALRRTGVEPASALHIGDSPEHDVEGALAAGLRAILLDRHNRHQGFERAPVVRALDEILEHL
ncbi:MAG: HAD-IA family hydrolase [Candidatus Eremiobacteraeota bacterium]|nr:HAD-IA family hydrolase [Candidatus Eremiobacteraeota bacterium]